MDRRRYVPSGEGLEGRALMSVFGARGAANRVNTAAVNAAANELPETFKQKEQRIEHLPFFLEQLHPGRYLPADTLAAIQADLRAVTGRLHAPNAAVATNFNTSLRHGFPQENLSADTAKILNHAFGAVIASAGADPSLVQSLRLNMNELAASDSKGVNSSYLATNDYALVLQTALAVGRPIPTPAPFSISARDGTRANNGLAGTTAKSEPTLVGTYSVGATEEGSTRIQAVDPNGNVVGSGPVDKDGKYSFALSTPLPEGTHRLQTRAIDALGHMSHLSRPFVLRVVPRPGTNAFARQMLTPPRGPLGLE